MTIYFGESSVNEGNRFLKAHECLTTDCWFMERQLFNLWFISELSNCIQEFKQTAGINTKSTHNFWDFLKVLIMSQTQLDKNHMEYNYFNFVTHQSICKRIVTSHITIMDSFQICQRVTGPISQYFLWLKCNLICILIRTLLYNFNNFVGVQIILLCFCYYGNNSIAKHY